MPIFANNANIGDFYGREKQENKRRLENIENICELNKNCVKNLIKEYIYIAFGCLAMAVGVSQFLLPNELSTGGFFFWNCNNSLLF